MTRASSMCAAFSRPATRKYVCSHAALAMVRALKKPRRYRPLAKWKIEAPWTIVLSRSKNAAASGSGSISVSGSARGASSWTAAAPCGSGSTVGGAPGSCRRSGSGECTRASLVSRSRPGWACGIVAPEGRRDAWETAPVEPTTTGPARVRLLTRVGCHLCDEARSVVAQVCADAGEAYEEVDLDEAAVTDPALLRRYTDEVPVTFVDGAQHDYWRVDPVRLRAALARTRA